jgi:hypothetical protein
MAQVASDVGEYYPCQCPSDDQGMVRPLVTRSGRVLLLCDSGGEVWPTPDAVEGSEVYVPNAPDWAVTPGVSIRPGTTRWATGEDLAALAWNVEWKRFTITRQRTTRGGGGCSRAGPHH